LQLRFASFDFFCPFLLLPISSFAHFFFCPFLVSLISSFAHFFFCSFLVLLISSFSHFSVSGAAIQPHQARVEVPLGANRHDVAASRRSGHKAFIGSRADQADVLRSQG
jgi:hypothetical protein